MRRWGRKKNDDAESVQEINDKCVIAGIKCHFVKQFKEFLDIKEPNTVEEFEALAN